MPKEFKPQRLDVRAFAEEAAELSGSSTVGQHPRLVAETQGRDPDQPVTWRARGELRNARHHEPEVWLHLQAETVLALACQRCLEPVATPLSVDRSFRFVADEAAAEAQDDDSEEDLLALSAQFDLIALLEDELLMAVPLVPRHEVCPEPLPEVAAPAADPQQDGKPNPFAILGKLKQRG
ncbi:YceD family protein [Ramlibacter rhizophilus]|uniref:Large ribosomal RNA subunit accumulation protein YceD n=1 Tax=Ramlibacter rhizophilus TaxID=1781167 RepID=A0A4Z0BEI1_9BURK|nr:YceD family protein [Ramlibacter rhizophilus]TFY96514.1 DUF177 domain-containing protein [Ramlibacter rhizophilus]